MFKIPCQKCAGHGIIQSFKHVEDGICFTCYGSGKIEVTEKEYNDYKEIEKQKEAKINDDFDKCYYYFFKNSNGKTKIKYNDPVEKVNKTKQFIIQGSRGKGFYIEIDGNKVNVKAKFGRTPKRKEIYIKQWVIS